MLDKIEYLMLENGDLQKTVTHVEIVQDIDSEQTAIQAQLDAFHIGRTDDVAAQQVIDDAIASYETAIGTIKNTKASRAAKTQA